MKTSAGSYRVIKADILQRVRNGEWAPGSYIPGEVELASRYGCSRVTVNRALRELAQAGIVHRRRKTGTQVTAGRNETAHINILEAPLAVASLGETYRFELLKQEHRVPPKAVTEHFRSAADAVHLYLCCRHWAGHRPYQLEQRWINLEMAPQAAQQSFTHVAPQSWLSQQMPASEAQHVLRASNATPEEAALIQVAVGSSLFVIERRSSFNGSPLSWSRLQHPSNLFVLQTQTMLAA